MTSATESTVLSPAEARERILAGEWQFGGVAIEGDLRLVDETIEGDLNLTGVIIKGSLNLMGTTIRRELNLCGAAIEGYLHLGEVAIGHSLNLATEEGPQMIYVSEEMAQLVHWSAPTTPLVVLKG